MQACFLQYHRRGVERGGREEPLWIVVLKTAGVTVAAALVSMPLGHFFWPLYLLPPAAGCAAFVHFRRTRFTPTYRKFRKQEATRFSITSSAPKELALPSPQIIDANQEAIQ